MMLGGETSHGNPTLIRAPDPGVVMTALLIIPRVWRYLVRVLCDT